MRATAGALRRFLLACLKTALVVMPMVHPPLAPAGGGGPFPAIEGWTLQGTPTTYTPGNLWDFIDGAAESYLAYSFVELQVGEYMSSEGVAVRVEVYRHADAENAFGIYATERAPDYVFMKLGAQGYQQEGILNFLSERYYVKLSTHQRGAGADSGLRTVAGRVEAHLAGSRAFPAGLARLPETGRQSNTEGFVAESFLGYGFLHHAFTARYEEGLQVFVMEYPTPDSAAGALRRLLAAAPARPAGADRFKVSDPNNRPIAIARRGRMLYGTVGAPDAATETRFLDMLERSTREH